MLLKDGKRWPSTKTEQAEFEKMKKKFKDQFARWPITCEYVPELIKKSDSPENKLPDFPLSVSFKPKLQVYEKDSQGNLHPVVYQYFENSTVRDETTYYYPQIIDIRKTRTFGEKDLELAWFIWYCYPRCRGGHNAHEDRNKHRVWFRDPDKEAVERTEKRKMKYMVEKAIIDDPEQGGLGEFRLKLTAKALGIAGVDSMNLQQVQDAMFRYIESGRGNDARFIELTKDKSEKTVKEKSFIQDAVDYGVINFDQKTKSWYYFDSNGKRQDKVLAVSPQKDPYEALYDFLRADKDSRELLEIALKDARGVEKT